MAPSLIEAERVLMGAWERRRGCEHRMSGEYSANGERPERRPITDPAIVRKRVQAIIVHNTGGPQPSVARVTSIIGIAARAGLDPATVRSVLDELAADGEIDRQTSANEETRVVLAGDY